MADNDNIKIHASPDAFIEALGVSRYPVRHPFVRQQLAKRDVCPECGGALDTGWECNSCQYDARDLAYPPSERALDKKCPD